MCTISSWALEKTFPWLSKAFLLFSAVSQCLLCYPVCPILCSGKCLAFREDAIALPSVRICFTQNPATRAWQRTDLPSAATSIFLFKKEQETWCPIILQTNSPEVIHSPATWCQERTHQYVENWVTDEWNRWVLLCDQGSAARLLSWRVLS